MLRVIVLNSLYLSLPLCAQPDRITSEINAKVRVQDDAGRVDASLKLGYVTITMKPTRAQ